MTPRACARERDVLVAAARGWSASGDGDLSLHVAECPVCLEMTVAAEVLREQCARDLRRATPPSPAVVWWRLERRLRADRARAAERPLTIVHAVAGAVGLGLTLAILQFALPWAGWLGASVASGWESLSARAADAPQIALPFVLMALALLVLAPTAIYLGLAGDDR